MSDGITEMRKLERLQDMVHEPKHYTSHPSGIECIEIAQHMNFCLGNAMKYIWRAGLKGDAVQDLEKAIEYLNYEINRLDNNREKHYNTAILTKMPVA